MNKEQTNKVLQMYTRSEMGLCKNDTCYNKRRDKSAFCQECSNKHAAHPLVTALSPTIRPEDLRPGIIVPMAKSKHKGIIISQGV